MKKITAIYKLIDPLSNEIRYIGKSVNPYSRFYRHIYEANKKGKKKYLYCWIKSLLNQGLLPIIEIIEWTFNWKNREIYWIKYYKKKYRLTNLSIGGEGSFGYFHTEKWKRKASNRMKGNKIMVGRKLSMETRSKMSISQKESHNEYPVYQYNKDLKFIKKWESVKIAANFYNIVKSTIYNNLMKRSKTTKYGIWSKYLINNKK